MGNVCGGEEESKKRSAVSFSSAYGPSHGCLVPRTTANMPRRSRRNRSDRQKTRRKNTTCRQYEKAPSSRAGTFVGERATPAHPSGLPGYSSPQSTRREPENRLETIGDIRMAKVTPKARYIHAIQTPLCQPTRDRIYLEPNSDERQFAERILLLYEEQRCFKLILEANGRLVLTNNFDRPYMVKANSSRPPCCISNPTLYALLVDGNGQIIRVPFGREKTFVARTRDAKISSLARSRSCSLPSLPAVLWGRILTDFLPYRDCCAALSLCRVIRYHASKFVTKVTITSVAELDVETAHCFPSVTSVSICYAEMVGYRDRNGMKLLRAAVNTVPFLEAFPNKLESVCLHGMNNIPGIGIRVLMRSLCEAFRSKSMLISPSLDLQCDSYRGYSCAGLDRAYYGDYHSRSCRACRDIFTYFPLSVVADWVCHSGDTEPKLCIDERARCRIIMARPGGGKLIESHSHIHRRLSGAVKAKRRRIPANVKRGLQFSGAVIDDKIFCIDRHVMEWLQAMKENGLCLSSIGKKETLEAMFGNVYKEVSGERQFIKVFDPQQGDLVVRIGIWRSDVAKLIGVGLPIEFSDFSYLYAPSRLDPWDLDRWHDWDDVSISSQEEG